MKQIVECVPNFSEGRDAGVIEQITAEIKKTAGVELLDVDPGRDTNRTVVTFAGSPAAVEEAAFQAIRKAAEVIDMSMHKGAHPRMGATDVCPFVPVAGVTMADCVEIARKVARRVGEDLSIPAYLYEEAAASPERRSLAYIREGEYEGLPEKLKKKEFKPDYGKAVFNKKAGATVIGAREFLIAYNVNLNTRNVKLAKEIANRMREKGYTVKNPETGARETVPGTLKAVRAVGWYIPEYQMAQISVNLLNYNTTPLYRVFEEAERLAAEFGVRVTGSELVGLIPLEAVLQVGRHFLRKQGNSRGVDEKELVRVAVQSLGLAELTPFHPEHKIIEYRFRRKGPLAAMDLVAFCAELASDSPAPGGGSIAALNGALSAGLSAMVGNLTFGKKGYEDVRGEMEIVAEKAQPLKDFFIEAIDKDTEAFNRLMAAFALPKKSDDEKKARQEAIDEATKGATLVPFTVLERSRTAAELALAVAKKGNRNSLSDAGVAGLAAALCAEGALYNVLINTQDMAPGSFRSETRAQARNMCACVLETAARIKAEMDKALAD
ncbi:MAG: glutamate formimidoyltransferase [Acidobacteria bacterium]|jgi:glutamate formiminotransferase/formiminotetrahydrofolate cyclodeaminase|nr:glutamate formimidoyltransferase [Acidobacteriota bacterium]